MSSAPVAALIIVLTLAAVLLTSGIAKLRDKRATRDAFVALRVPPVVPLDAAARALPWVEIALAVLLLAAPSGWLVPVAAIVAALMLAYTGLVARALSFDEPVTCSCFGTLGRHEVDRTTLGRNVLLATLASLATWWAAVGGSVPHAVGDLAAHEAWTLLAAATAVAVAVLVAGGAAVEDVAPGAELLDYDRSPVPHGVLRRVDGRLSTLSELAATQARLLVVLSPACGPCIRTAEKLDTWAAQLAPVVGVVAIYPDEATAAGAAEHAPELAAWEPEHNVRRVFSVGTPAAILLGADGFLAGGPVAGENKVARFVDDVLTEMSEHPFPVE